MGHGQLILPHVSGPVDMRDRLTAVTRKEYLWHNGAAAVGALILLFIHRLSQLIGGL